MQIYLGPWSRTQGSARCLDFGRRALSVHLRGTQGSPGGT